MKRLIVYDFEMKTPNWMPKNIHVYFGLWQNNYFLT